MFEEISDMESNDNRDVVVFEKLRFQNVFRLRENAKPAFLIYSGLKSVFENLCFRDGLVASSSKA